MTNALQAVLDKAAKQEPVTAEAPVDAVQPVPRVKPAAKRQPAKANKAESEKVQERESGKFYRPVRDGRRFVGAHLPPEVARQLRLISAEDDTTIQALLEEAIDLLFVKKGRAKISTLMNQ
jgi:hypothetical protein